MIEARAIFATKNGGASMSDGAFAGASISVDNKGGAASAMAVAAGGSANPMNSFVGLSSPSWALIAPESSDAGFRSGGFSPSSVQVTVVGGASPLVRFVVTNQGAKPGKVTMYFTAYVGDSAGT
jgi:hypothetical protein